MRQLAYIRNNRYRRTSLSRAWVLLVALAAALACPAMTSAGRFPADPVEELRQALRLEHVPNYNKDMLEFRKKNLENKVKELRTVGDLGRALLLQDWRDTDLAEEVRTVDREVRTLVAVRFEKAVRAWLERGDVAGRAAVADLVGEMAVTARGIGSRSDFALKRLALLVPDLLVLAQAKEARLQEAAARALGKIQPDHKDVKNDAGRLGSLLKADGAATRRVAAEALVNLIRIEAQTERRTRTDIGFTPLRNEVIYMGAAVVTAAAGGLSDSDVEVRRQCAGAIHESAMALADLVVDVPAPDFFPPEGRTLTEGEKANILSYKAGVEEERAALKPLLDAIMKQAESNDAPLIRAVGDADVTIRVLARNTIEEAALTRQRLQRRQASIPKEEKPTAPPPEANRNQGNPLAVAGWEIVFSPGTASWKRCWRCLGTVKRSRRPARRQATRDRLRCRPMHSGIHFATPACRC